jgi:hypothetical protein
LGASLKKRQTVKDNIEEITTSNELVDYIRGEKRYENVRPDVDYTRWLYIADYLKKSTNSNVKRQITEKLLLLLESKTWQDIYAVASICLKIDSPEVDKKLEQRLSQEEFFSLPEALIGFVSRYVFEKRMNSVAYRVAENAIKKNQIDWIVTLVSLKKNEQEEYWNYCETIIDEILRKTRDNDKVVILENISLLKEKAMEIISNLEQERTLKT